MAERKTHTHVANEIAICGCGAVFIPDERTESFTYNGREYMVHDHQCYDMAKKDPASVARDVNRYFEEAYSKLREG